MGEIGEGGKEERKQKRERGAAAGRLVECPPLATAAARRREQGRRPEGWLGRALGGLSAAPRDDAEGATCVVDTILVSSKTCISVNRSTYNTHLRGPHANS